MKKGDKIYFFTLAKDPYTVKVGKRWRKMVDCICVCGKEKTIHIQQLVEGGTKSCKCQRIIFKDREKAAKMRASFDAMHNRCSGKSKYHLKAYVERGITVCEEWKKFPKFYEDMEATWQLGLQLDRKDNDLGYCKQNCRWATIKVQQINKRSVKCTEKIAEEIRLSPLRNCELMKIYNFSSAQVSRIKTGKRWKQ